MSEEWKEEAMEFAKRHKAVYKTLTPEGWIIVGYLAGRKAGQEETLEKVGRVRQALTDGLRWRADRKRIKEALTILTEVGG